MKKNNLKKTNKISKKSSLTTQQVVNMGNVSIVTLGKTMQDHFEVCFPAGRRVD